MHSTIDANNARKARMQKNQTILRMERMQRR